jgi:hypothetical protein
VNPDAWPTPSEGASREPLPRVEDLPVADQGYDQESVRAAFDSFYRHAAQLDAALRTLEAVDSFHRQAAALRADLRTLRAAGWTQQPFGGPPSYGYGVREPREGISPALWRILGEVVFLIAVAVLLGVAKLHWWVIVGVMAAAFLIIALIEWAASRDRWTAAAPARGPAHPIVEAQPAPRSDESDSIGWAAFEEAQEPSDAMTIIGAPHEPPPVPANEGSEDEEPEPVVEAAQAEPDELDVPAEPAPETETGPASEPARRRWWRRTAGSDEAVSDTAAPPSEAPRHVRVLGPEESAAEPADPWERGFEPGGVPDETAPVREPDEKTDESGTPLAADSESEPHRRFRRR